MSDINHRSDKSTVKVAQYFFKNPRALLVLAFPFALFMIFLCYELFFQLPKAKQTKSQLESEYNSIIPLPNANASDYRASNKTSQALVSASYVTDSTPDDIFNYYDGQLKQHGWLFYGTKKMRDWGRDFGGTSSCYYKGDYSAKIQYAGQLSNYGWTYAFSMSWGLGDCKSAIEGGWVKQSVPVSIFLITFGIIIAVPALGITRIAWSKTSVENLVWRRTQSESIRAIFRFPIMSTWRFRILSIIGIFIGFLFIWAGAYSLWRNIFSW